MGWAGRMEVWLRHTNMASRDEWIAEFTTAYLTEPVVWAKRPRSVPAGICAVLAAVLVPFRDHTAFRCLLALSQTCQFVFIAERHAPRLSEDSWRRSCGKHAHTNGRTCSFVWQGKIGGKTASQVVWHKRGRFWDRPNKPCNLSFDDWGRYARDAMGRPYGAASF